MNRGRRFTSATVVGVALLVAGAVVILSGYVREHGWNFASLVDILYANLGSELIGMAVVILLVDRFAAVREDNRRRAQLVRELASSDRSMTARAGLELEAQGWLYDGTLAGARLGGANLVGARFERAALMGTVFAGADLSQANLSGAALVGSNLTDALLHSANLEMADLTEATLVQAQLVHADASLARLNRANLSGADLTDADMSHSDLSGADLTGCRLVRTHLDHITWNQETRWPIGFTPPVSADRVT